MASTLGVLPEEVERWTRDGIPGCRLGDQLITLATYAKDGHGRTSTSAISTLQNLERLLKSVGNKQAVAKWLGITDRSLRYYRAGVCVIPERLAERVRVALRELQTLQYTRSDDSLVTLLERLPSAICDSERRSKTVCSAVRRLGGWQKAALVMGLPVDELKSWPIHGVKDPHQLNRLLELARHGANRPGRSPTVACLDRDEIETAISIAGGPTALAKRVGITARSMRRYRSGARAVGAELAQAVRAVINEHSANNVSGSSGMPLDA